MTTKPKIKRKPAKDNPWYKFILETTNLDKLNGKHHGWYWLMGLRDLHKIGKISNFNFTQIQNATPDGHWLKTINAAELAEINDPMLSKTLIKPLRNLISNLKNINKIKKINLSKITFKKSLRFSNLIFPIETSFAKSELHGEADFSLASFQGMANFTKTSFLLEAYFRETNFSAIVFFKEAEFHRKANFEKATFFNYAVFESTEFSERAFFNKAKFSGVTVFKKSVFAKEVSFDKVKITGHTNFIETEFKKYAPKFYNATLYQDTFWDKIKWPDISKPIERDTFRRNQNAYENLSAHMKKLDKYPDEHFFFRQEMSCRRRLEKRRFMYCLYWLYDIISDYGYGIERVLFWWVVHILLGAIFIGANAEKVCNKSCDLAGNFLLDLVVSLANAHGVLFFSNGPLKDCYKYFAKDDIFNIIWGVQTIVGIPLLFLLLLTLRTRFRLK